eukprot:Pgem_evm1s18848
MMETSILPPQVNISAFADLPIFVDYHLLLSQRIIESNTMGGMILLPLCAPMIFLNKNDVNRNFYIFQLLCQKTTIQSKSIRFILLPYCIFNGWILLHIDMQKKSIVIFPTLENQIEENYGYYVRVTTLMNQLTAVFDSLYTQLGNKNKGDGLPFFNSLIFKALPWWFRFTPMFNCPPPGTAEDSCARMLTIIKHLAYFYSVDKTGQTTSHLPLCDNNNNCVTVFEEVARGKLYLPQLSKNNDDNYI